MTTSDLNRNRLSEALDAALQPPSPDDLETLLLTRFQAVAETVPAYRAFLTKHGIAPAGVRSLDDYRRLPLLTKQNYNQRYPLSDLCRNGRIESCDMFAVSSGSTGAPTFWLRGPADEMEISLRFEQVVHDSFRADERRTLAVVCFPLGTWVGGMYTTACLRHVAARGYPITIVTPGNNKAEILRVVQALGEQFEQTVLLGYPPFVKDVIDSGIADGVEWGRYRIKMVFAGEVFSEEWRDLVCDRAGAADPIHDTASLYGTADAGVLANETPLSIAIRRRLAARPEEARALFGESRLPTLAQYDPKSRYFETVDGTLLFSGDNGIPLIRYHIQDTGGIIPYERMMEIVEASGFSPPDALAQPGSRGVRPLPFVYVFGRSHFAVSYYGANVYPENVMVGLEQPEVRDWVTGKFVMQVTEGKDRSSRLSIVVELARGAVNSEEIQERVAQSIQNQIARLNSEFANYVPADKRKLDIELRATGDPEYFPLGVKHRYTR